MTSQESLSSEALLSVRLCTVDHYMSEPVPDVDVAYNAQRGAPVRRVPVVRIFGPTAAGQKCCLHLHGIFPYIYVPVPAKAPDGFDHQLMASLDKALNLTLGAVQSRTQHVYRVEEVSGTPFYGYHPRRHRFYKIYFYNPALVKRASDMLLNGALMGKHLQPFEAHVPFALQFMMDYNLQGMNFIHLSDAKFRRTKEQVERMEQEEEEEEAGVSLLTASQENFFLDDEEGPKELEQGKRAKVDVLKLAKEKLMPESCERISSCELEVDAVAADILNHNDAGRESADGDSQEAATSSRRGGGMNPGLRAIWEDERERRRLRGLEDEPLTPPSSPPRPEAASHPTDSDQFWRERFLEQLEKIRAEEVEDGTAQLDSQGSSLDPDATCNFQVNAGGSGSDSQKERVYPAEATPEDAEALQDATFVRTHIPAMSAKKKKKSRSELEADLSAEMLSQSYLNSTIVDEEALSQSLSLGGASTPAEAASSQSQRILGLEDDEQELVEMLAELGHNRGERLHRDEEEEEGDDDEAVRDLLSQVSKAFREKDEEEERQTLEMSQIITFGDEEEETEEENKGEKEKEKKKEEGSSSPVDWGDESFWDDLDVEEYL